MTREERIRETWKTYKNHWPRQLSEPHGLVPTFRAPLFMHPFDIAPDVGASLPATLDMVSFSAEYGPRVNRDDRPYRIVAKCNGGDDVIVERGFL